MNPIDELIAYHDEMARTASWAANAAGMAKGAGLNVQADKHRAWAKYLRTLVPPTQTTVPKLRGLMGGRSG